MNEYLESSAKNWKPGLKPRGETTDCLIEKWRHLPAYDQVDFAVFIKVYFQWICKLVASFLVLRFF